MNKKQLREWYKDHWRKHTYVYVPWTDTKVNVTLATTTKAYLETENLGSFLCIHPREENRPTGVIHKTMAGAAKLLCLFLCSQSELIMMLISDRLT